MTQVRLAEMREDHAWRSAMEVAKVPYAIEGYTGPVAFSGWDDVDSVVACDEGENDGSAWIALLQLKDGRYLWLSAGCDYTGWDCQAGGFMQVGDALDMMVRLAMGTEDRSRLGFVEPGSEGGRDGG